MNELISVIVPVYNVEKYLNKCVDSILNQTECNFELILIDDGSTDKSGNICDEYALKDERVIVIHKDNGGVSSARNEGIKIARGEYITFVDSDDYVESDFLELISKNPKDLTITGYVLENEKSELKTKRQYTMDTFEMNNIQKINEYFIIGLFNYCWGKLYKKEIIIKNDIIFNEDLDLGEDTIFNLNFLRFSENISIIQGCLYHYIKYNHQTLSNGIISKNLINEIENLNSKIFEEMKKIQGGVEASRVVTIRISYLYKNILNEIICNVKDYSILRCLFKGKWFRNCLDLKEFLQDESKKFKLIMNTKSCLILYLYLKYFKN